MAGVEQTVKQWTGADPRVTLGVNLQLPADEHMKNGTDDPQFLAEVRFARERGLPVAFHYGNTAAGLIDMLDRNNLLGPDILMVHPQGFTEKERATLVEKRVPICSAPAIEIPYSTVRNGYIQFDELEKLGAVISISTDATSAIALGDFFTVIRALQWAQRQRTDANRMLPVKRYIEIATIGGAKALGLDAETGSLTPGKWADLITVRKSDINMAPVIDPYNSLVFSGAASNVDTVMVGGKVLVSGGRHQSVDVAEVVAKTKEAGLEMHQRLEEIIAQGKENAEQMNRKG